jgi:hypothetical protein
VALTCGNTPRAGGVVPYRHDRPVKPLGCRRPRYALFMSEDTPTAQEPEAGRPLPKHLAALVGALRGPDDLGANHDAYLTYPSDGAASGGAASA